MAHRGRLLDRGRRPRRADRGAAQDRAARLRDDRQRRRPLQIQVSSISEVGLYDPRAADQAHLAGASMQPAQASATAPDCGRQPRR